MGLDHYEVKDFIEEKGLCELNHDAILTHINNKNYTNCLKPKEAKKMDSEKPSKKGY